MKKALSLFLAVIYLATSSGLALQVHHCMGKVQSFSLVDSEHKKCGKCGMKKGLNACCKDELKFVKLYDSHKPLVANYQLNAPDAIIHNHSDLYNFRFNDNLSLIELSYHSPPLSQSSHSLHILNCVFRI